MNYAVKLPLMGIYPTTVSQTQKEAVDKFFSGYCLSRSFQPSVALKPEDLIKDVGGEIVEVSVEEMPQSRKADA